MTTPFWQDEHLTLYGGDCRAVLATMAPESVHCVVTSPPYWGLRDYGTDGQLGLEPTPEEYVANMVAVFREVRRVLRNDGTLWLNLGDSYAASGGDDRKGSSDGATGRGDRPDERRRAGLKPKDLVGIPWRVAFALQADGWYLRSDIIWSKPNPMPESVTDRPTKAHEYLFLLTKQPRYYFDADAVREPMAREWDPATNGGSWAHTDRQPDGTKAGHHSGPYPVPNPAGRNLRSVWNIATEPYPGAHFATFPRKLVEPCVKAGTSERGVCPECGAPWVRVVTVEGDTPRDKAKVRGLAAYAAGQPTSPQCLDYAGGHGDNVRARETTGWRASCAHDAEPVPAVVLDPFAGSGTTLLVAQSLGRRGVGIDLSPEYLKQALARNAQTPLGLVG